MYSIFIAKRSGSVQIAKSAKHLLVRMKRQVGQRRSLIEAQGDKHHEIDLRLISEINRVLEPLIGPSEGRGAVWFQSTDWYGDGIRHLEFQPRKFPTSAIPQLQALLTAEYSPFGVLCWAPVEVDVAPEHEQGIVIFSDAIVVTAELAASIGMPDQSLSGDVAKATRR